MKHFFLPLLIYLFLLLPFGLIAQDKGDIVVVRFSEVPPASFGTSEIIISYGNNVNETIELQNLKKDYPKENLNTLNEVITKLYTEGYEIISTATNNATNNATSVNGFLSTLWIFRKKEK